MTITNDDKDYDNVTDMFDDMDKQFKKEHPILNYIDSKLPHGIFNYRATYALLHPQIIVRGINNEIKWTWQRVFRGWDDRVVWSIDMYLAENIPHWFKQLKETKQGIPIDMFGENDFDEANNYASTPEADERAEKKYDDILDKIISGFDAYKTINDHSYWKKDPEFEDLNNKFNEGFDLLRQYFGTFWD
jgi:hypothetical protein